MGKKNRRDATNPVLGTNRSARHEYHLERFLEAGIVLSGPEVKSARLGRIQLKEAYAKIRNGEVFLHNAHIGPYAHARLEEYDPLRPRKLLLHAREIRKLAKDSGSTGMTIVPTRIYLKSGRIKVEIAVARGKRQYDKREAKIKKDAEREMARARTSRQVE